MCVRMNLGYLIRFCIALKQGDALRFELPLSSPFVSCVCTFALHKELFLAVDWLVGSCFMALSLVMRRAAALTSAVAAAKWQREDAVDALRSLVTLCPAIYDLKEQDQLSSAFISIANKDISIVADVMQRERVDPAEPCDGSRIAFLMSCVGSIGEDETVWESLLSAAQAGLGAAKWDPVDCRTIVSCAASWGVYDQTILPGRIEQYVAAVVSAAAPQTLICLNAMLTSVTETSKSPMLLDVARRAIQLSDTLGPVSLGILSRQWLRAKYQNKDVVAAFLKRLPNVVEKMDLRCAVPLFAMAITQPDLCTQDVIAMLFNKMSEMMEDADADLLIILMRALHSLPESLRVQALPEWQLLAASISDQCNVVLTVEKSLSIETSTILLLKYFQMFEKLPKEEVLSEAAKSGMKSFAAYVEQRVEDFVSDANPPFSCIYPLVQAGVKETQNCALTILEEAAAQEVVLPTLNVFKFLLLFSDHALFQKNVMAYLCRNFLETAAHAPIIQLCTALKCFSMALYALRKPNPEAKIVVGEDDDELALRKQLLSEAHSIVQTSEGKDVRCCLSIVRSMYEMCYDSDAFFEMIANALAVRVDGSTPAIYGCETGAICLVALKAHLPAHPQLEEFLKQVVEQGLKREETVPSKWMNENDPSNVITPLTAEQAKMRELIQDMKVVAALDVAAIEKLAKTYVELLPMCRLEDLHMIFTTFADKTIKLDKILNEVMKYLIESQGASKLSPFSISAIMQGCASIRFAYHGTAKKFLLAITEEQWGTFDAGSLGIIVAALSRLSLRQSPVLTMIGERVIAVSKTLSALDCAQLIAGLQSLGFHEEAVLSVLIQRARDIAAEFSPTSLQYLFTAPYISRLLTSAEVAAPLLKRLTSFANTYSPMEVQRISKNLKKCPLPKEALAQTLRMLELPASSSSSSQAATLGDELLARHRALAE